MSEYVKNPQEYYTIWETKYRASITFAWLVCGLGIVFPLFVLFFIGSMVDPKNSPIQYENPNRLIIWVILLILFSLGSSFVVAFLLYGRIYKKIIPQLKENNEDQCPETQNLIRKEFEKINSIADIVLYISGVITIFLIYCLIQETGGLWRSPMSFYLSFIPSAIAIAFRSYRGIALIGAVVVIAIILLFYNPEWNTVIESSNLYKQGALAMFVYQILLVVLLEYLSNRKERRTLEKISSLYRN
ncbi:hypothetical protein [Porphyromonas circumdentaria]|uniref:Uncharacterized protein n=1 Tax=Porphyromonas circumdentaria TaxID=29524 RepID=A0A1T4KFI2_9PORP|nr:hypothetical protein [Porphyromonas circumdentaria]MBB6275065.1 ABC-type multidrug transport system fused ATPase/permease subunit [Porphyromonas circumdentaria]SJZ41189.1 hypothetical protein SAMN02745171_00025 [Porphyromonas circumdentaria]